MKKFFGIVIIVALFAGLMGFLGPNALGTGECIAAEARPFIIAATPLVKMSKKSKAVIMGSGFKPGQQPRMLIITPDGLETDITGYMKPAPKADATGTWASTWPLSRYIKRKLVTPGVCKITATDFDYNPIAHTTVFFQKPAKKKKK